MRIIVSFIGLLLIQISVLAQHNAPIAELLKEAKGSLYSRPEQTGRIAAYIIGQEQNNLSKIEATLLLAQSFYVRGNYDEAVKNGLEAKKMANASHQIILKTETTLFAVALLRELGLHTLAKKYLAEIKTYSKKNSDTDFLNWIQGKLLSDRAAVAAQQKDFTEAAQVLKKAKRFSLDSKDSTAVVETDLALFEIYVSAQMPDSAKIYLEKLQTSTINDFQKATVSTQLGILYFQQKEYPNAVESFQKGLKLSVNFPNKNLENSNAEGLSVTYLALEDTENFLRYQQKANTTAAEVEVDKSAAINSVFNFINTSQKERSEKIIEKAKSSISILGGGLLILLLIGYFINYTYTSKTKEYGAIYKYLSDEKSMPTPIPEPEKLEKSYIVSEETEHYLLQKLAQFESGKKFTNPDMSIALLASQFDTNTKYLSEVINRQKGKNFNSYINELRINYIIEKLKTDSVYFNYKISYLAEECGFSSHSSFTTVFKSVTGISPTTFMKFLQKHLETA